MTQLGWAGTSAPRMLILGEAWGAEEAEENRPFVGTAGRLLYQILGEAIPEERAMYLRAAKLMHNGPMWLDYRDQWLEAVGIAYTNVLNLRPENNKLDAISVEKKELPDGYPASIPPILTKPRQRYLQPEFLSHLDRLGREIENAKPNLVALCGNTACWALLQTTAISSLRGTVSRGAVIRTDQTGPAESGERAPGGQNFPPVKCLPTYHPAAVLYNWHWRSIVVADLMKAWRESETSQINRPRRTVITGAQLWDIEQWIATELLDPSLMMAADIETAGGQITMISFALSKDSALTVRFRNIDGSSYWPEHWQEMLAWKFVIQILRSPNPKVFQNGMYDIQWLLSYNVPIVNPLEDSMLLHHSIQPEMQKGLGFLGSIYTSEPAWKLLRKRAKDVMEKKDE